MITVLIVALFAVFVAWCLRWTWANCQGGCLQSILSILFALIGAAFALGLILLAAGLGGWEGWLQP